jgi:co-chaperonin GroES (HSP10)
MNNEYKSQMQNVKFSPDFNERTIKLLQDYKNDDGAPLSLEIKSGKERPRIITVVKAVSLSLAACLLCVFTVTLVMEQNKTESIPEVTNITYTYDVKVTEAEPEIIEDIEEYTPFAAPNITDPAAGAEPFNISPPVAAVAPETTTAEPPVTTVTQAPATKVTEAPATIVTTPETVEDAEEEVVAVEEDSAEDADVVYDDSEVADDEMLYESEEDASAESSDDEMAIIDNEDILTTNIVAVKPNRLTVEKYINSINSISNVIGSLTYNGELQGEITPADTKKLMDITAVPFASNTDSDTVTLLNDKLEFVLTFSDNYNTNYTICLYSDAMAIVIENNGNSDITAVTLDSSEHDELFKTMYLSLFSQSDYELYMAEISGK